MNEKCEGAKRHKKMAEMHRIHMVYFDLNLSKKVIGHQNKKLSSQILYWVAYKHRGIFIHFQVKYK